MRDSVSMGIKIGWVQSVDPWWLLFVGLGCGWEREVFAVLREKKVRAGNCYSLRLREASAMTPARQSRTATVTITNQADAKDSSKLCKIWGKGHDDRESPPHWLCAFSGRGIPLLGHSSSAAGKRLKPNIFAQSLLSFFCLFCRTPVYA